MKLIRIVVLVLIVLINIQCNAQTNRKVNRNVKYNQPANQQKLPTTQQQYKLANKYISRTVAVQNGIVRTIQIVNKLNGHTLQPSSCDEFKLRISQGTDKIGTDKILTNKNFTFVSGQTYTKPYKANIANSRVNRNPNDSTIINGVVLTLRNKAVGLTVKLHYELANNAFYMHKYLTITTDKPITLERIDVEAIAFVDASQPYKLHDITAVAYQPPDWKPGLGQPLYTTKSATFWGIEFPAAYNFVKDHTLNCGYLWGRKINPTSSYKSYLSVIGVADNYKYIDDAFYKYIDQIRIRPLRLQVQYNSWFDFGGGVNKENFLNSARKINDELVIKRHCRPLNAYVIDSGWQDTSPKTSWSDEVWKINSKFTPQFRYCRQQIRALHSHLGLWLSPGCLFLGNRMVARLGKEGYEALKLTMSIAGPKYMSQLQKRIIEFCKLGISYFKFDGLFGHLYVRDFELNGRGVPVMPQLNTKGFSPHDKRLNSHKYDELKTYYLVAGTERLIRIFDAMARVNPHIFITISNGAYLSPWWLQHVDVVWLINAGDAAKGSTRTQELVYRDGIYYQIWKTEHTKFPKCSIFNHEPKKRKKGENPDVFRKYLFMNLSRGTGFVELYLKTQILTARDWDVLAQGLHWAYKVFPTFKYVRMHGGNPRSGQVYGYTAWNSNQGYISFHNPSDKTQTYTLTLNRKLGLVPPSNDSGVYTLSSPLKNGTAGLKKQYRYGETLHITLKPKEIRILDFNKTQYRTPQR